MFILLVADSELNTEKNNLVKDQDQSSFDLLLLESRFKNQTEQMEELQSSFHLLQSSFDLLQSNYNNVTAELNKMLCGQ